MQQTIDDFWNAFREYDLFTAVYTSKTPMEMVVGGVNKGGWVRWQMLPCEFDLRSTWSDLERELGNPLPEALKQWYSAYFTLNAEIGGVVRLPANPSNAALQPLRENLLMTDDTARTMPFRRCGLLPFGDEARSDAGPMCLDMRGGGDPDAWPIRFWDHDWAGRPEEISPIVFSNFERMLACCAAFMRTMNEHELRHEREKQAQAACEPELDANKPNSIWRRIGCLFSRRRAVEEPTLFALASPDCLSALRATDPDGAGGPGREYWGGLMET